MSIDRDEEFAALHEKIKQGVEREKPANWPFE